MADVVAEKVVLVTLQIPSEFLRALRTNVMFKKTLSPDAPLTAGDLVARIVLMEAMGAPADQIAAEFPMEWRQGQTLDVIHDERRVYQNGEQIAGPRLIVAKEELKRDRKTD